MSELNGVRFQNFLKRNTSTMKVIRDAVSDLAREMPKALEQICYSTKNQDSIVDMPVYEAGTSTETAELIAQFRQVQQMVEDYEMIKNDPTQVDAVMTARSISIADWSNTLIRG